MKRARILVLAAVLFFSFALPAWAWVTSGPATVTLVINPTGIWACGSGQEWRLRTVSSGFGPFDSTGTGVMLITSGGHNYQKQYSGEWDGVTRTWYTGLESMTYAQFNPDGLSNIGDVSFYVSCA